MTTAGAGTRSKRFAAGTVLFEENDHGTKMYVIRKGRVRIFRRVGDNEIVLATLLAGDFCGEMALLEKLPRSATAQVVEDSILIEVDQSTFEHMIRKNAEIGVRIMRKLAARVRELDRRLQNALVDSGVGRAVEVLRWLLPKGVVEGSFVRVRGVTAHVQITAQAGLSAQESESVLDRLRKAGCLREIGADVLIANVGVLDDYSTFLDLKRKYEPHVSDVPTEAQKLKSQDARKQMARLLKALQVQPTDAATNDEAQSVQFKRYAELKARFEPDT